MNPGSEKRFRPLRFAAGLVALGVVLLVVVATAGQSGSRSPAESQNVPQSDKLARVQKALEAFNTSFRFYGRVVNTEGVPIDNVHVMAAVDHFSLAEADNDFSKTKTRTATTDRNGFFEISGEGGEFSLGFVKEGYIFDNSAVRHIRLVAMTDEERRALGERNAPVEIVGWSLDGAPVAAAIASGSHRMYLATDGHFASQRLGPNGPVLQVAVSTDPAGTPWVPAGWSTQVRIEGGSVQPASANSAVQAPESGYREVWVGDFHDASPQEHDQARRAFFFKTSAGSGFGSLAIEWTPYFNKQGQAMVVVDYRINTGGGRFLVSKDQGSR